MENKKNNEFSSIDFIIFEKKNTALATAKCMELQENSSKNETISLSSIEKCVELQESVFNMKTLPRPPHKPFVDVERTLYCEFSSQGYEAPPTQ
jgi:hypothetical protein